MISRHINTPRRAVADRLTPTVSWSVADPGPVGQAMVATEDSRFYRHPGVAFPSAVRGLFRAIVGNTDAGRSHIGPATGQDSLGWSGLHAGGTQPQRPRREPA